MALTDLVDGSRNPNPEPEENTTSEKNASGTSTSTGEEDKINIFDRPSMDLSEVVPPKDTTLERGTSFSGRNIQDIERDLGYKVDLRTNSPREIRRLKDKEQTTLGTLAKESAQLPLLAAVGTVESAAHLADLDSWDDNFTEGMGWIQSVMGVSQENQILTGDGKTEVEDLGNRITREMRDWKESLRNSELLETHKAPGVMFDPYDPSDYIQTISQVGETAGSFLAVGGALGAAGRGLVGLAKLAGASQKVAKGVSLAQQTASSFALANAEGTLEGMRGMDRNFRKAYDANLEKGMDPEEARKRALQSAGKTASRQAAINTGIVGALQFTQLTPLFRSPSSLRSLKKLGLARKKGETLTSFKKRIKDVTAELPAGKKILNAVKEPGQEAAEELGNVFSGKAAESERPSPSTVADNMVETLTTGEGAYAAAAGALGGKMQDVGIRRLPIHQRPEALQDENVQRDQGAVGATVGGLIEGAKSALGMEGYTSAKVLEQEQRIHKFNQKKDLLKKRLTQTIEGRREMNEGVQENDLDKILKGRQKIMSSAVLNAVDQGVEGQIKGAVEDWRNLDNQEAKEKHGFETDPDSPYNYEKVIDEYSSLVEDLSKKKEQIESGMDTSAMETAAGVEDAAFRLYGTARTLDPIIRTRTNEEQKLEQETAEITGGRNARADAEANQTTSAIEDLVRLRQEGMEKVLSRLDEQLDEGEPIPENPDQIREQVNLDEIAGELLTKARDSPAAKVFGPEGLTSQLMDGLEEDVNVLTESSRFRDPANMLQEEQEREVEIEPIPDVVSNMDPETKSQYGALRTSKEMLKLRQDRLYEDYKAYRDGEKRSQMMPRMQTEEQRKREGRGEEVAEEVENQPTSEEAEEAAEDISPNEEKNVKEKANAAKERKQTEEKKSAAESRDQNPSEDAVDGDESSSDTSNKNQQSSSEEELENKSEQGSSEKFFASATDWSEDAPNDNNSEPASSENNSQTSSSQESTSSTSEKATEDSTKESDENENEGVAGTTKEEFLDEVENKLAQIRQSDQIDPEDGRTLEQEKRNRMRKQAERMVKRRPSISKDDEEFAQRVKQELDQLRRDTEMENTNAEETVEDGVESAPSTPVDAESQGETMSIERAVEEVANTEDNTSVKLVNPSSSLAYKSRETYEEDVRQSSSNQRAEGLSPSLETAALGENDSIEFVLKGLPPNEDQQIDPRDLETEEEVANVKIAVVKGGEEIGALHVPDYIDDSTTVSDIGIDDGYRDNIERQKSKLMNLRKRILRDMVNAGTRRVSGRISSKRGGHVSVRYTEESLEDPEANNQRDLRPISEALPALSDPQRQLANGDLTFYVMNRNRPLKGQDNPADVENNFENTDAFVEGSVGIVVPMANQRNPDARGDRRPKKIAIPVRVPKLGETEGDVDLASHVTDLLTASQEQVRENYDQIERLVFVNSEKPRTFPSREDLERDKTYLIVGEDSGYVYIGKQSTGEWYTNNPKRTGRGEMYDPIEGNLASVRKLVRDMYLNVNLGDINRSPSAAQRVGFEVAGQEYRTYNQFLAQHLETDLLENVVDMSNEPAAGDAEGEWGVYMEQPTIQVERTDEVADTTAADVSKGSRTEETNSASMSGTAPQGASTSESNAAGSPDSSPDSTRSSVSEPDPDQKGEPSERESDTGRSDAEEGESTSRKSMTQFGGTGGPMDLSMYERNPGQLRETYDRLSQVAEELEGDLTAADVEFITQINTRLEEDKGINTDLPGSVIARQKSVDGEPGSDPNSGDTATQSSEENQDETGEGGQPTDEADPAITEKEAQLQEELADINQQIESLSSSEREAGEKKSGRQTLAEQESGGVGNRTNMEEEARMQEMMNLRERQREIGQELGMSQEETEVFGLDEEADTSRPSGEEAYLEAQEEYGTLSSSDEEFLNTVLRQMADSQLSPEEIIELQEEMGKTPPSNQEAVIEYAEEIRRATSTREEIGDTADAIEEGIEGSPENLQTEENDQEVDTSRSNSGVDVEAARQRLEEQRETQEERRSRLEAEAEFIIDNEQQIKDLAEEAQELRNKDNPVEEDQNRIEEIRKELLKLLLPGWRRNIESGDAGNISEEFLSSLTEKERKFVSRVVRVAVDSGENIELLRQGEEQVLEAETSTPEQEASPIDEQSMEQRLRSRLEEADPVFNDLSKDMQEALVEEFVASTTDQQQADALREAQESEVDHIPFMKLLRAENNITNSNGEFSGINTDTVITRLETMEKDGPADTSPKAETEEDSDIPSLDEIQNDDDIDTDDTNYTSLNVVDTTSGVESVSNEYSLGPVSETRMDEKHYTRVANALSQEDGTTLSCRNG